MYEVDAESEDQRWGDEAFPTLQYPLSRGDCSEYYGGIHARHACHTGGPTRQAIKGSRTNVAVRLSHILTELVLQSLRLHLGD